MSQTVADLMQYEASERELVHRYASLALTGDYVARAEVIYSDVPLGSRVAFRRNGAPLAALLFLYEQVVVYLPPLDVAAQEERLGFSWDECRRLINAGCLVPVIGHPTDYAALPYIDFLVERGTPSVWSRGDELALEYAGGRAFWDLAHRICPHGSHEPDAVVARRYGRVFPALSRDDLRSRIELELKTNYVDMCIYGFEPLASELLHHHNEGAALRIFELSEYLTYPTLIGMGGTPNYGLSAAPDVGSFFHRLDHPEVRQLGPESLELLRQLDLIGTRDLDPEWLLDFHSDGMAKDLWAALDHIESALNSDTASLNGAADRTEEAQRLIRSALVELGTIDARVRLRRAEERSRQSVELTTRLGAIPAIATMTLGPLGHDWATLALSAVEAGLYGAAVYKSESLERRLHEVLVARYLGKERSQLARFWWLKRWRDERPEGQ